MVFAKTPHWPIPGDTRRIAMFSIVNSTILTIPYFLTDPYIAVNTHFGNFARNTTYLVGDGPTMPFYAPGIVYTGISGVFIAGWG